MRHTSSSSCSESRPDIRSYRNGFSVPVKGLVAHPFYRMEKSLPGRRAEPKNVYLTTLAYGARAEIN